MPNYEKSKVKEWMKRHPKETEAVRARYDELKVLDVHALVDTAMREGVDVRAIQAALISKIIASEGVGVNVTKVA